MPVTEATIEGRCPFTGSAIMASWREGRVVSVRRLSVADSDDLPWLVPGFIDLQVNGYGGHDVNGETASPDSIAAITELLASQGVTTWVPTVITASPEGIEHSLAMVAAARRSDERVARAIPFVHVEGPFLSEEDGPRGAHDPQQIRPIDADEVARWTTLAPIGYVTVSPHWPDAADHIARIVASGVRVSIGHTSASVAQIMTAVDAGATLSTHLGNGIYPLLPRHPNPIWAQLADPRLMAGFIGDGHHLPAETLTALVRAKGVSNSFLVSDSVTLAGAEAGVYTTPVGGSVEVMSDGRVTLPGTGVLAGSGANLAEVVQFVVGHTGLSLREAIELASITPARFLGRSPVHVQAGARADLVTLDHRGRVLQVVRQGQLL